MPLGYLGIYNLKPGDIMLWPKEIPIMDIKGKCVFYALPHQTKIIEALSKNLSRQFQLKREVRERSMNFTQAVECAKAGSKVRRSTWDEDMLMWWKFQTCLHTHPYDESQASVPHTASYYYVVELDDVIADDWHVAAS